LPEISVGIIITNFREGWFVVVVDEGHGVKRVVDPMFINAAKASCLEVSVFEMEIGFKKTPRRYRNQRVQTNRFVARSQREFACI
jgi:hypothetical protein